MLLHCQHAFNQEARKLMCVATDTDVVVIAIASATRFIDCEAWIEFGHGKHKRYIPLHSITASLGQDKSLALPFFHAFSGCDTISSVKGIGEKNAWDTWQVFPDATPVFMRLSSLSRFTVLMYRRTSDLRTVNETRLQLFAQGGRQIDMVPQLRLLSRSILNELHIKRSYLETDPGGTARSGVSFGMGMERRW